MVVERIEGDEALGVGLVCSGRQFVATLDGWNGTKSLLQSIDRKWVDNESMRKTRVFENGRRATVTYTVIRERIRVEVDGSTVIDWEGDATRLSLPGEFVVPGKQNLFVASYESVYHYHQIRLTALED